MPKKQVERERVSPPKPPATKKSKTYSYAYPEIKTKLDDDLIETICEYVAGGHTLHEIANYLCVPPQRLYMWRTRGEAVLAGGSTKPKWHIYGRFILALRKAAADYVMSQEKQLHRGKGWYRNLRILQVRNPGIYGMVPGRAQVEEDFAPDERYL